MKRSCCQISPGMCLQFISQPDRQRKELLNKPINGSGSDEGFTDNAFLTSLWSFWTVLRMWNPNVQLFERLGENGNKHETNVNKNLTSNEGCSHIIPERTRWKQNLLYELIRRSDGRSCCPCYSSSVKRPGLFHADALCLHQVVSCFQTFNRPV